MIARRALPAVQEALSRQTAVALREMSPLSVRGGFRDSYLDSSDPHVRARMSIAVIWIATFLFWVPVFQRKRWSDSGPCSPTARRHFSMRPALATALMTSAQTVMRYIDLRVNLLLVRRLKPFHRNTGKRLVKSKCLFATVVSFMHCSGSPTTTRFPAIRWRELGSLCHQNPHCLRTCPDDTQSLSHRRECGDRLAGDPGYGF